MPENNSHTQFIVPGEEMGDEPFETYDLNELGRVFLETLGADDYWGYMDVTLMASGDVIRIPVTYHVTTEGLVDVQEA